MAADTDFSPAFNTAKVDDETTQTLKRKPLRHLSVLRQSSSHLTLVSPTDSVESDTGIKSPAEVQSGFQPIFRSVSCAEKGPKQYMEYVHICIDNLPQHLAGEIPDCPSPGAFYGVFDGHGGIDAASFVRKNILKFIVEDSFFNICLEKAIKNGSNFSTPVAGYISGEESSHN